jgi:hypothetical protein
MITRHSVSSPSRDVAGALSYYYIRCPHTTVCVLLPLSSSGCICVLIVLLHLEMLLAPCGEVAKRTSACACMRVRVLTNTRVSALTRVCCGGHGVFGK